MPGCGRYLACALILLSASAAALAYDADRPEILTAVRHADLDLSSAITVDDVGIEAGPGSLDIRRGVLIPAEPFGDRVLEFVFLGEAHFRLQPPDAVEAGQLELFTGAPLFNEPIRQAVLSVGRPGAWEQLQMGKAATLDPGLIEQAATLYSFWQRRMERRNQGVEAAMFRVAAGDPTMERYFGLFARTRDRGDFFFDVDPEEMEQVTLGQFVPFQGSRQDTRLLARHLRAEQRKGRWIGLRIEDIGQWDVWTSSSLFDDEREPVPGDRGIEPYGYVLDVTIDRQDRRLHGRALLKLQFDRDDHRFVTLGLHPDLEVDRVTDRRGTDLFFFKSGNRVIVELETTPEAGARETLEVVYDGHILRRTGHKEYVLRDTAQWYPHCGTIDRARYDVTFRWPKKLDLVASGRRIDGGVEDGMRWERRIVDTPGIAVSFELGDFVLERARVGHVLVNMAFSRYSGRRLEPELREESIQTVVNALKFFQQVFGPYPLHELNVVTVPRPSSQSFLGFMTLSDATLQQHGARDWRARKPIRDGVIAHEMAHQWWGNLIGWRSYRDQWLSEAMANYASLLYLDYKGGGQARRYLVQLSAGWRDSLSYRLKDGRTVESLGPLVLGERLNSSKASDAYQSIVYRKGAVVLAMLARSFTEEQFLGMLKSLVDKATGRVIGTDSFVRAMERMSGRDLDEFAQRYIYGTGIPEVYYTYRIERDKQDGRWLIRGEAHQLSSHHYRHAVIQDDRGVWDVRRERIEQLDVHASQLMVPVRIELDPVTLEPEVAEKSKRKRKNGSRDTQVSASMEAILPVRGASDTFEIAVPGKPRAIAMDPRGEVLANFHGDSTSLKRVLHYRARAMAELGRTDEADRLFREALSTDPSQDDAGLHDASVRELRRAGELRDARIHIDLARMNLDAGDDAAAAANLEQVERLLSGPNNQYYRLDRMLLRARLEVRAGDYDAAYHRIRPLKQWVEPRTRFHTWRAYAVYLQFQSRRDIVAEAIALYAVAARLSGREIEYEWAVEKASDRGCNLGSLVSAEVPVE